MSVARLVGLLVCGAAGASWGAQPQLTMPPVVSSNIIIADGTTAYTVSMTVSDADGYNDVRDLRTMFGFTEAGGNPAAARGYLLWGRTDSDITRYGGNFVIADAAGGGRWAYMTDSWGGTTYITPQGCQVTVAGSASGQPGSRTVTWTFAAKPAWAWNPLINDADAFFADYTTNSGWQDNPNSFAVVASACTTFSAAPRAPWCAGASPTEIDVAIDPADSNDDLFAIRISPVPGGEGWVQQDGSIGASPRWLSKAVWGTKRVGGLMWNSTYTFEARAARNQPGYCPSPWGPATQVATLGYVPAIRPREHVGFDPWVRGQCPYRMISTSGYPQLWSITQGSLARGLAGGLDADTYDWRDITSGSNWGLGGGAFTTLQFLQYARDYQAAPMLTANMFGGGYKDADNGGVFVCQTDNPEGLAADWARYINVILPQYRQGQEGMLSGENLRVW